MTDAQRKELAQRLIVALDVDEMDLAMQLVDQIGPLVERYKIGSRMFTAHGPRVLDALAERGKRVFLDLKYHDIPSVIADSVRLVAERHPAVFLLTVHASGGAAMVAEAVEAAAASDTLQVVAVTALTSLSPSETRILGIDLSLEDWVLKLASLALEAGAHGLVCSPNEVASVRQMFGPEPTIVTPGVRPQKASRIVGDDQVRTATPRAALDLGSSYLVMGRPIVLAENPREVVRQIAETF